MAINLNPLLLQALAARGGGAANPALQALLAGTGPAETGEALPSAQELLSQLETTNPTAGLIAKYMLAAREAQTPASTEAEADAEEQASPAEEDERLAQVVQRLQLQVRQWRAELERLRERNDILAAALGACYLCWGQDPGCPACRGTGRPGSRMPDLPLFDQWVVPALQTRQIQKEVNRRYSNHKPSNDLSQSTQNKRGE